MSTTKKRLLWGNSSTEGVRVGGGGGALSRPCLVTRIEKMSGCQGDVAKNILEFPTWRQVSLHVFIYDKVKGGKTAATSNVHVIFT